MEEEDEETTIAEGAGALDVDNRRLVVIAGRAAETGRVDATASLLASGVGRDAGTGAGGKDTMFAGITGRDAGTGTGTGRISVGFRSTRVATTGAGEGTTGVNSTSS